MIQILGVDPASNNSGFSLVRLLDTGPKIVVTRTLKEFKPGRISGIIPDFLEYGPINMAVVEKPPPGKGRMSAGSLLTLISVYGATLEALAVNGILTDVVTVKYWRDIMLGEAPYTTINRKKKNGDYVKVRGWTKGRGKKGVDPFYAADNLTPAVKQAIKMYYGHLPEGMTLDEMEATLIAGYGIKSKS